MSTNQSPTPEDYRRAGLQAARRRALLMIVLLTLLAAVIIGVAAWLISGYEPPSTAAETHVVQVTGSTVAPGDGE